MRQRMESWDAGAKKDAMHYIKGGGSWAKEDFFGSGAEHAEEDSRSFFGRMNFDPAGKRMLDIGCGIGRTMRAFSDMFSEVYGVDFSTEMIKIAKELNKDKTNLFFATNNGSDLSIFEDNFFDFCYSRAVFQHTPDISVIEGYIGEIDRVLKPGGLFKFQVNGRKWVPSRIPIIHRSLYNFLFNIGLINMFAKLYFRGDRLKQRAYPPPVLLSKARLARMLDKTSLEVVEITGEDTFMTWCSGNKEAVGGVSFLH